MPGIERWLAVFMAAPVACAFIAIQPPQRNGLSSTSLHVLPPPLIIGPMLKKMKEDEAKKNKPMVDPGEATEEANGLKVGKNAWKWPAVWPYDEGYFKVGAAEAPVDLNNMAGMLSGVAQVPGSTTEEKKFEAIQFWSEKADIESGLDPESAEKLTEHYDFYLRDGMSILEIGASENSYLPAYLKPSRVVGVGANKAQMEKNAALTESLVVDLNDVVPDRDVDSDELRKLAQEPFDAIIMANTVGYLASPREVFRSAWYLLKPGGTMIVSFPGKDASISDLADAETRIWKEYNDDQHVWITGSFFHFSASDGWESLLGFDITPEDAKPKSGPLSMLSKNAGKTLFVVQAVKGYQYDSIDDDNLEKSISSLCWMLPGMEERDKELVVRRLARAVETAEGSYVKATVERNIQYLPRIYEGLLKMDQFAFTFSMQSQVAADLVCDPDFNANEAQMAALYQGLGLKKPQEDFWLPVGKNTGAMEAEDRISLLSYIVPRFGSGDEAKEECLQAFVNGMKPTYDVIRAKCPDWTETEVQLLGTELLAAEMLNVVQTTREDFAKWLGQLTDTELRELLSYRKAIREDAKENLFAYQKAREDEQARLEEYRVLMEQQIEKARSERSLIFNPRTEKMEIFERKK